MMEMNDTAMKSSTHKGEEANEERIEPRMEEERQKQEAASEQQPPQQQAKQGVKAITVTEAASSADIMALPPRMARHQVGSTSHSQPGAYAECSMRLHPFLPAIPNRAVPSPTVPRESVNAASVIHPRNLDAATTVEEPNQTASTHSNSLVVDEESGLAVASVVEDRIMSGQDLPQAQPYDTTNQNKTRDCHTKKLQTIVFIGATVLVAVIVIAVTIGVSKSKGSTHTGSTEEPLMAPSEAPTVSPELHILSLLDERTIISMEDPDSPQSKAYHWLIQDIVPSYSDNRIKQRFALATLFFSAGGDKWDDNTHWLNHTVHECDWFNSPDFARKTEISKLYPGSYAGFLEPLPTSQCSNDGFYQHLWLDQNNLLGSIPKELFMLTTLQTISMGWNQLDGTISNHIGKLTALEGLFLQRMRLSGTIPTGISLLTNLVLLGLSSNNLEGEIPSDFWKLANLRDVSLRRLQLKGTLSTEIGALSKLREFFVAESGLSGTFPTELGKLKALESLGVYNSRFTGSLPSELGQLKVLSGFRFNHNLFNGTLPTELGLATSLTNLVGRDNQFSGQIPSEFGLLSNLNFILDLQGSFLSGTLPTELGILTQLKDLEFQNNQISGQIPSELGELSSLGLLNLANNSLSGTLPEELSFLQQSLYGIALEGNQLLSGSIPASLCTLNGTCSNGGWDPCRPGLSFDCSAMLCGCGCSCLDSHGH